MPRQPPSDRSLRQHPLYLARRDLHGHIRHQRIRSSRSASYSRRYSWMGFFVAGNIVEILGWAGRLAAHYSPLNFSLYVMQICPLIIAPAFMSASLYWAGGIVVSHLDPSKSWLSGKWFKIVFMIADLISLVIQTIGGGLAGSAAGSKP
ncbi:Envelope glycoprotein gp160 [Rhodotorula toruloides]